MLLSPFQQLVLDTHNRLRSQHTADALCWSEDLSEQAQQWAERLAIRKHLAYCQMTGVGENITFFPKGISGEEVVLHWYREHVKYEYDTPGWQANTNYFTQVVWKATEEIGVGTAECLDEDLMVVVAFYRPAGNSNRANQFQVNVHKPVMSISVVNNQIKDFWKDLKTHGDIATKKTTLL